MNSLAFTQNNYDWSPVSESMQSDIIGQIRKRRGLDPRPPAADEFFEKK
jgi:hypothetical protein